MTTSTSGGGDELSRLLAASPAMLAQILVKHECGGDGRCTVCRAGPQAGNVVWPCRLWVIADRARCLRHGGG